MAITHVIAELNRIRDQGLIVDYAVGGAVAAQAYIETSSTEDVDVFVFIAGAAASSLAPLTDIWTDLVNHGAVQDGLYLVIGGWPVQLLAPADALYEEAIRMAQTLDFGGHDGKVMRPEHLAAIALQTGRSKDYQRVAEFIRQRRVGLDALAMLVKRFGLAKPWTTFLSRYPLEESDE